MGIERERVEKRDEQGRRGIRSFVLRASRLNPYQKEALKIYRENYTIDFESDKVLDFKEVFGNDNPTIFNSAI